MDTLGWTPGLVQRRPGQDQPIHLLGAPPAALLLGSTSSSQRLARERWKPRPKPTAGLLRLLVPCGCGENGQGSGLGFLSLVHPRFVGVAQKLLPLLQKEHPPWRFLNYKPL